MLVREREAARADMLAALDSVRWERLAKGLAAMAQQGPARRSVATRVPAVIGMPELVVTRHDAVAKAAKRAKRSGLVTDFHRLRIRCKRLRYSLEFASEVYEGRTGTYVRALTAVQDELGLMQDAEVALLRLADLATGDAPLPAATVFVMGGLAERYRRDVGRYLRRLPKHAVTRRRASMARPAVPHGGPARRAHWRRSRRHAARCARCRGPALEEPPPATEPGRLAQASTASHPAAGGGLSAVVPPSPSSQRE